MSTPTEIKATYIPSQPRVCMHCFYWQTCQDDATYGECHAGPPTVTLRPEMGQHHHRGGWLRTQAEQSCGAFAAQPAELAADPIEDTLETGPGTPNPSSPENGSADPKTEKQGKNTTPAPKTRTK